MTINNWGSDKPIDVADGGTGVATLADGAFLIGNGASDVTTVGPLAKGSLLVGQTGANPTELTVGSDNQVLVCASGQTEGLQWQKKGADDSLNLLETITISNDATITTSGTIDSTYKHYILDIINLIPVTDSKELRVRYRQSGGSVLTAANYKYAIKGQISSGTNVDAVDVSNAYGVLSGDLADLGNDATETYNGRMEIWNPSSTSTNPFTQTFSYYWQDATHVVALESSVVYDSALAIDAIQLYMSSGNLSSGTLKLYGVT